MVNRKRGMYGTHETWKARSETTIHDPQSMINDQRSTINEPSLFPYSFPIEWQQNHPRFVTCFCMPDNPQTSKKSITPDWLVQGALTRIGDMLDKLTGRSWKPASSLATSGLVDRMKTLLT